MFFTGEIHLGIIIKSLIIILLFGLFRNFVTKIIIKFLKKVADKYNLKVVTLMLDSVEKPLRSFVTYTGIYCALIIFPLVSGLSVFLYKIYRTLVIITVTQGLLNLVTAYSIIQNNIIVENQDHPPILKTMFPLLSKCIKFLIVIIAIVAVAAEFDFKQLNSLLAGVGIAGASVAFAAQDMLKNFFGGFVVLTDQSFNVGDFIKVNNSEGTVEELGIRSTKIRTLEQELIVVPNSKFSEGEIINYTKRDQRRVKFTVGAVYSTSIDKLKTLIEEIKLKISSNPQVKKDSVMIKFDGFGQSSLNILVQYMVTTSDYNEYMSIKDEINFEIMEIFEAQGVDFAFQSMSVYMEK